jgi:hypothetical protein
MMCNNVRWNVKMCDEMRKCASVGIHRAYGALYRNVLHDIPMEVQVIMRLINGLLAWICPLRAHRNMSPYTGWFLHSSGWFLHSSRSPLDAPPELSASEVLWTSFGPYWTLSGIKGTILGWGAQCMSWGQSPSESVILTPMRDCMHLCAWPLTES